MVEIKIARAKTEFEFEKIGWLRIILVRENLLFVKYNQALIKYLEKIHCYVCASFCIYLGSEFV